MKNLKRNTDSMIAKLVTISIILYNCVLKLLLLVRHLSFLCAPLFLCATLYIRSRERGRFPGPHDVSFTIHGALSHVGGPHQSTDRLVWEGIPRFTVLRPGQAPENRVAVFVGLLSWGSLSALQSLWHCNEQVSKLEGKVKAGRWWLDVQHSSVRKWQRGPSAGRRGCPENGDLLSPGRSPTGPAAIGGAGPHV